jgi:triphosphoribosyl-dephospho-CoA synthase
VSDRQFHVELAEAAQLACLLEASAPKPGNVSPGVHFGDTSYEDFLASAAAIGVPLGGAGTRPLGDTIHLAVRATRRWTSANTNLGLVLLLAPLARAAAMCLDDNGGSIEHERITTNILRRSLRSVLAETTIDDARETYAAIRLAAPGGLGSADNQDVSGDPSVTLTEAMRLAADRDGIAREYATSYQDTFETGSPALIDARRTGLDWSDAVVHTYLTLLAARPDTHIVRRAGQALADNVTRQARHALECGGTRAPEGRAAITLMATALRDERNQANPGTTADLTAASIFVVLLGGGWQSRNGGPDAASR